MTIIVQIKKITFESYPNYIPFMKKNQKSEELSSDFVYFLPHFFSNGVEYVLLFTGWQ